MNRKLMKQNKECPPLNLHHHADGGMSYYTAAQPPTVGSQRVSCKPPSSSAFPVHGLHTYTVTED